jgi:mannose-6-phosphate isomerase-like protein (cupin superfamily)
MLSPDYCGKLLYFHKGKRCSFQYHRVKDEVFYLPSGRLLVRYAHHDDPDRPETIELRPGMRFAIPTGLRHRMIAPEDSELFEFSTHHEDADSVRVVKGD